jgi:hypothetical protein
MFWMNLLLLTCGLKWQKRCIGSSVY